MNEKRGGLLWGNLMYQRASITKKNFGADKENVLFWRDIVSYHRIFKKNRKGQRITFFRYMGINLYFCRLTYAI